MQARFSEARAQGLCEDTLLLLEHPPVLTLGRGATRENVLADPEELARRGVEIFETDRGGDVTYHGPGQVVGYPLLFLPPGRQDVRRYVRDVEQTIILTLARWGIEGRRESRYPGVWVDTASGPSKIAAIGVHLSRWHSRHGFALNVNTDLSHFGLIIPCGIREAGVISMERLLGRPLELSEVQEALAQEFAHVFEAKLAFAAAPARSVCVILRTEERVLVQKGALGGWLLPSGAVLPGETPALAAARVCEGLVGTALTPVELGYRHFLAAQEVGPPSVLEEIAFAAEWQVEKPISEDLIWLEISQAARLLQFKGHQVALAALRRTGP